MFSIKKYIIETEKLIENINNIKNYVKTPIIGVVKGDGYGLGLVKYSTILKENGINIFAVAGYEEAITLADNGFDKIVLLTPQNEPEILEELINKRVRLTVGSLSNLNAIKSINTEVKPVIHLKIDTGFGRFGFSYKDITLIESVFKIAKVEAVYSHFSSSFEKQYKITKQQNEKFRQIYKRFADKNVYGHIANSCAALRFPDTRFDAVRIGSAFLGRLPVIPPVKLNKIGYLKTTVIDSNIIRKGENIGYGNTFRAKKTILTANVEVGYKDGFDLKKDEEAHRLVDIMKYVYSDIKSLNKKLYLYENEYEVLGRVGMYSTTIINDKKLKPNDEIKVSVSPVYIDSRIEREFT